MKRFGFYLVFVPFAVVVLLFALANRQMVSVSLNLFGSAASDQQIPLFLLVFLVLMIGVAIGGSASWLSQGRHRKAARHARAEAERYRLEVERLKNAPTLPDEPASLPSSAPF